MISCELVHRRGSSISDGMRDIYVFEGFVILFGISIVTPLMWEANIVRSRSISYLLMV